MDNFRKELRGIDAMVDEIVRLRQHSSQDELYFANNEIEKPRDVFSGACESIAQTLLDDGFTYSKSERACKKKHGDFIFSIAFTTSSSNSAGRHVSMSVGATVHSKKLAKWRKSYPLLRQADAVAGGHLGNLGEDSFWLKWELANPETRARAVADIVSSIRKLALPYFTPFQDLDTLIPFLTQHDFKSMDIQNVIEFLMCFSDRKSARLAASQFLCRRPDLVAAYQSFFGEFADLSARCKPTNGCSAADLALSSYLFEFGDLTK